MVTTTTLVVRFPLHATEASSTFEALLTSGTQTSQHMVKRWKVVLDNVKLGWKNILVLPKHFSCVAVYQSLVNL